MAGMFVGMLARQTIRAMIAMFCSECACPIVNLLRRQKKSSETSWRGLARHSSHGPTCINCMLDLPKQYALALCEERGRGAFRPGWDSAGRSGEQPDGGGSICHRKLLGTSNKWSGATGQLTPIDRSPRCSSTHSLLGSRISVATRQLRYVEMQWAMQTNSIRGQASGSWPGSSSFRTLLSFPLNSNRRPVCW